MPNWVYNTVTVEKNCDEIFDFIKGEHGVIDFEKIVPMPKTVFKGNLGEAERKEHGENNWYDWSCSNWGTKWNASDSEVEGDTIQFSTAWSHPEPVIEKLSKRFPDVEFTVSWEEEQGYGAEYTILDGEVYDENEWDMPEHHTYTNSNGEDVWILEYPVGHPEYSDDGSFVRQDNYESFASLEDATKGFERKNKLNKYAENN